MTRDDHFDERDHKDNFYGVYATWKKIQKHVLDLYTFLRDTEDRFPTNHYFYGYADQVSLQNLNDIKFGLDLKPAKKFTFSTSLHLFYLDEEEDALYNAARRPVRFDPTGTASSPVGQELDILAKYYFTDHGWVESGYSHFFTGGFIEETGPSRDLDFFYALISFKY